MEIVCTICYNIISYYLQKCKGENMGKKVTWLHLSDLHFRVTEDKFESELIYDRLLEDLKHIEEHIDLVFVTGDIAYSGRTEEYVWYLEKTSTCAVAIWLGAAIKQQKYNSHILPSAL